MLNLKSKYRKIVSLVLAMVLVGSVLIIPQSLTASAATKNGLDVFHGTTQYNLVDWSLLAKQEQFIYIKSTEATNFKDPTYVSNYTNAKKVGLSFGAYHFLRLYSVSSCIAQADFFWSQIKGTGFSLVPVLDCESYDSQTTSVGVRACIASFLNEFYKDSGIHCLIYACPDYITNNDLNSYFYSDMLWEAQYNITPDKIKNWNWVLWQFSSTSHLSSIGDGLVNLDFDTTSSNRFYLKYNIYTTTVKPKNNAVTKSKVQVYDANGNIVTGYTIPANTWIYIKRYTSTFWEVIYPSGTHWTNGYISTATNLKR
jgi:lysozyme